jgi:hypothetical protein
VIVADVDRFLSKPPLTRCTLVVDQSECGRPVVDLIRRRQARYRRLVPVTVTAGTDVTPGERGGYRAAKVVLVSCLQVLLQGKRLRFAGGLAETPTLLKELANYRMKTSAAVTELFSAREGQHDDLVLGLAVACWYGEKTGQRGPWKAEFFDGPILPLRWGGPVVIRRGTGGGAEGGTTASGARHARRQPNPEPALPPVGGGRRRVREGLSVTCNR